MLFSILAQNPPASSGPSAETVFYLSLAFIFLTAIVTTVITKWAKDKCLKFFDGYHVTIERFRGQTTWGDLRVFSNGLEIVYDHPFIDVLGHKRTSYLFYQMELDGQILSILRYHDELMPEERLERDKQVHKKFNPNFWKRSIRNIGIFINTLRDALNQALGASIGQFQKMNPQNALLSTQSGSVTQIGQTILGRFANAYEPLLETYIGQPVIMEVADALNPNNAFVQYTGYLADYTQQWVAIFNVEHQVGERATITLPDIEHGEALPPLPPPPAPNSPAPELPKPYKAEHNLAVRIDGPRFKVQNTGVDAVAIRRLEREGFEPLEIGVIIPPSAILDLPAHDARGGRLFVETVRCVDVVAPRKFATIRHAGVLLDRPSFVESLELSQLPLVPKILHAAGLDDEEKSPDGKG